MSSWNLNPAWTDLVNIVRERVTDAVGITDSMFNALMENTQYLKNHLGLADVAVGKVVTNTTKPNTLASVDVQERLVGSITYLDFIFNMPAGMTGATGAKGEQGRGFYRSTIALTTSSTKVARPSISPTTGKLLVSDTIVDKNGLVFEVTREANEGALNVDISYRTSIKGDKGEDYLIYYVPIKPMDLPTEVTAGYILSTGNFNRTPVQGETFTAIFNALNGRTGIATMKIDGTNGPNPTAKVLKIVETTGAKGEEGKQGEKGHGFYRVTGSLTTSSTTVARNLILPNTGKLLVSDSLVDSNGLVFAVMEEASEEVTDVKIAYRASIRGATGANGQDGADGATPIIGENGNWWINGEDTGKPSRGATGATGANGQDGEQGEKGEQGDSALMASRAIELTNTPIVNTSIILGADTSGTDTLLFNRTPKNGDNTYLIGLYQSTSYLLGVTCTAHGSAGTTMLINSIVDISSNSSGGGGGTGGSIFYLDISAESSVTALQARNAVNAYNANSVVLCRFAGMLTATLVSVVGSAASMTGNTVLTFLTDLGGTIIKLTIDLPDSVSDSEEITVQQEEFGGGGEKKRLVFQNDDGLGQSFPATGGVMEFSVSESIYNKWIEIWWQNEDGTRKRTQMYFANATSDQVIERSTEVTLNGTVRYFSYYLRKITNLERTYLVFGVKDTSEYSTINMKIYRIYILEE